MNLLYALTSYPPATGGAQLLQHQTALQLAPRHSINVVSLWDHNRTDWLLGTTVRAPGSARDYVIDGIPVHRIGLSPAEKLSLLPWVAAYYPLMSRSLPPIAAALERHLLQYAADIELVHNVRIGREGISYAALSVARRRDVPFVLTPVHHPRWSGWRYRAYDELYRMADAVLALTEAERQTLQRIGVAEERITICGMGPVLADAADAGAFRERFGLHGPLVLFLGQHYDYKGYRQVLEAAELVWRRVPEAQFVFVGPAVGSSERAFAGADKRIHRLGAVDLQTKTDALAACSLLCVPSVQESFGGIYTEAWSFAKPVIGGAIPAIADVIDEGENGFLVPQQAPLIAERITELLLNPGLAERLGAAGRAKVEQRFTWQCIAERVERCYQTVMAGA